MFLHIDLNPKNNSTTKFLIVSNPYNSDGNTRGIIINGPVARLSTPYKHVDRGGFTRALTDVVSRGPWLG